MTITNLKSRIPDYAKDIKLNLSTLAGEETLNDQQKWGCFLACAMNTGNLELIQSVEAEAVDYLSAEAYQAAKSAASIMAMNNVYYRFTHLAGNKDYLNLPAKLRMNVIGNPGVDKVDFELWSLAVSAQNGCGMCIDAHEAVLEKAGMGKEQIQAAVRIGATINAVAVVLTTETALETEVSKAA
ncbi:MAG: alkyl hydroperoxide reductase [Alphaproteobacteria bacterium]|nr:alkyl hydroperoxide reductase [Alphaproteobacteria bacterium]|tara:strand:- start:3030 stop:3581 length:552 start_codon:yes stop_codon:yes gene_type:complete